MRRLLRFVNLNALTPEFRNDRMTTMRFLLNAGVEPRAALRAALVSPGNNVCI